MHGIKIGDAAVAVGVEAHVLRHWESVGLLHPPRSGSGHRCYDSQTIDQARLVSTLRHAGLSLNRIRELGLADRDARPAIVAAERTELRQHIELLRNTDRFLAHIAQCQHPIISECPDCAGFAAGQPGTSTAPTLSRNGTNRRAHSTTVN